MTLKLSEIWRYPVKSMRGTPCNTISIDSRGPAYDRHWMLVDQQGHFLTQRQNPQMALIQATLTDGKLSLQTANDSRTVRPIDNPALLPVTIWRDQCQALHIDPETDAWLSQQLKQPCRLVEMPKDTTRAVDPRYASPKDQVGFADGYPFLLITQASLDHLNQRLETPIGMQRFRPNLVITGSPPHAEDAWREIRIGDISFRVAKPCTRCIIPSIDPDTAERNPEPLKTLLTYRQHKHKILFGQNLLHNTTGVLHVGSSVEVIA